MAEQGAKNQSTHLAELEKALLEYDDVLRSAQAIAHRGGASTNWEAFYTRVGAVLVKYHGLRNKVAGVGP